MVGQKVEATIIPNDLEECFIHGHLFFHLFCMQESISQKF